jgi:hypothetical protein
MVFQTSGNWTTDCSVTTVWSGGRKYMPGGNSEPMARAPAQKPATAAGRKPATPPLSQVVDAYPRT